jgi:hypothetical protein
VILKGVRKKRAFTPESAEAAAELVSPGRDVVWPKLIDRYEHHERGPLCLGPAVRADEKCQHS